MLTHVKVSAPGKVILLGEHAVVYGKKALACSLEKRITCTMKIDDSSKNITIRVKSHFTTIQIFENGVFSSFAGFIKDVRSPTCMDDEQFCKFQSLIHSYTESKLEALLYEICLFFYVGIAAPLLQESNVGLIIDIVSELPFGGGLGSSASLSVSLAYAFLTLCEVIQLHPLYPISEDGIKQHPLTEQDLHLINDWAFQGEKIAHERPSGIDNSVITFGGFIMFTQGKVERLERYPAMKIILVFTKVARRARDIILGVKERHDKFPRVYEAIFNAMEALVEEWKILIEETKLKIEPRREGDDLFDKLVMLTDLNQGLLRTLGVSHESINKALEILNGYGFKGKLTGAGGGGCLFAVIKPGTNDATVTSAVEEIEKSGYDCWTVLIGGDGVKCLEGIR